jgi:kynurenine 3-monooxygenase
MNVAIAGAGLVGSLLAVYFRRRKFNVSVFERRPDMRRAGAERGRSINLALSHRGIRALKDVGLDDRVKREAIPMHGRMMHDQAGNLSHLPYGQQGQFINSISRSDLNVLLINEAEEAGAQFFFSHRCSKVDAENGTMSFVSGDASFTSDEFDMIIGADGAFSVVRSTLQITDRFDYSQAYIDHGYKELLIAPGSDGTHQLDKNALHIWPRESYMLIALPNPDGSFTCTLFFAYEGAESFNSIRSAVKAEEFFKEKFPDALRLMPDFAKQWEVNPVSSLVTIGCYPWHRGKVLLIGDAAHAVVPFYGQGMNAGFEDCRILNDLLNKHGDNWSLAAGEFQQQRKPDTDAIAELALHNFIEMRDLVADPEFLLRKKIEATIHQKYPEAWIPLYSMVTFKDDMRYSEAQRIGRLQKSIMDRVMAQPRIEQTWPQLDFESIAINLKSQILSR